MKTIKEIKPQYRNLLFVCGFLITDKKLANTAEFPFYGTWSETQMGNYYVYCHPRTKFTFVEKDGKQFFLAGKVMNPFTGEYEEEKILDKISDNYGKNSYRSCVDELSGVFVYGVANGGKVEYEVDPSGMQSAFYGTVDGVFYLTSHVQIVADLCGLKMTDFAKRLINYKWYNRVMGPYFPADITQYAEMLRVVPNIAYNYDGKAVTHKRFYPLKDLPEVKNDKEYNEVIEKAADILKNTMALVPKKWNNPKISLTGGIDSNTTFASANGNYDKFEAFSYISAPKEVPDTEAAKKIAAKFNMKHTTYQIPDENSKVEDFDDIAAVIKHNNGYMGNEKDNELRKRAYLLKNLDADVEVKSWVSETIRCYWYKHYGRTKFPKMSPKLFRNLYKIFIWNRPLAHKIDKIFAKYIKDFEYDKIPAQYPIADMHFNEVTWGSWGGFNISEMKIYTDITFVYNNRKFLDLLFRVPLDKRISDQHHLDMKKYLNKELFDMGIRVINLKETDTRARLLNMMFTVNSWLPF
ncbi:MAG: hypothetical protein LBM65_00345 [Oscillospiraceae bacterium]|nr:hypothetical protein [Oscillospiraceae bacterium]